MYMGLNGSDGVRFLGAGLGDDVTNAFDYATQQVLPTIRSEVKSTVEPYVLSGLLLGLVGVAFGLSALLSVKKLQRKLNA